MHVFTSLYSLVLFKVCHYSYLQFCCFRVRLNRYKLKKNPLKNFRVMVKLNPYAAAMKRSAILSQKIQKINKEKLLAKRRGVSLLSFE